LIEIGLADKKARDESLAALNFLLSLDFFQFQRPFLKQTLAPLP
jgi:hypothetical protein